MRPGNANPMSNTPEGDYFSALGAEPTSTGRRQNEQPKTDRYGCSPRRGGSDSTVTRTCQATGEALLVPARNRRSKVGRITGETGKSAKDERVSDGPVVAMKRSNVCGAKWPCHLQCLQHRGRQGRDDKGVRRFAGPEAEDTPTSNMRG